MTVHYELRIYDHLGSERSRLALTDNFGKLGVKLSLDAVGMLTWWMPATHPAFADLEKRGMVEIWRYDDNPAHNISNHILFGGLYLKAHLEQPNAKLVQVTVPDYKWWLNTRQVAWYDGFANRNKFSAVAGETIYKTLVNYNLTSLATVVNGRLRDGTNDPAPYIVVEADGAHGPSTDLSANASQKVGNTLTGLAPAVGDFDLVRTGAHQWTFVWGCLHHTALPYTYAAATDLSSSLTFSVGQGNMAEPVDELDYINEETAIITGGQGQGSDRDYVTRNGPDYSASNDVEGFYNATRFPKGDINGLNSAGDVEGYNRRVRESLIFRPQETEACLFERDFWLGSKATAISQLTGLSQVVKITDVTIDLDDQGNQKLGGTMETGWI
jgi:hypothetical protein